MDTLVFNAEFFKHANEASVKERGKASGALILIQKMLERRYITLPFSIIEWFFSFILNLPIPIYNSIVYFWITNSRGLPHMGGNYLRALYYRRKLGSMAPNVMIDQNVFFANPKTVELDSFSFLDKGVIVMSQKTKIGRRVHIAPGVFISGGGNFEAEDYSCVAVHSNIITSTEVLKDGARCSGPMVRPEQRNLLRGSVIIRKDAFVGANVTILPNVVIGEGSVAGAGTVISKSTEPWEIYVGERVKIIGKRDKVRF